MIPSKQVLVFMLDTLLGLLCVQHWKDLVFKYTALILTAKIKITVKYSEQSTPSLKVNYCSESNDLTIKEKKR